MKKIRVFTKVLMLVLFSQSIQSQEIIGYSGLFTFNTKHQITGTITNANTGLPIQGALLSTLNYTSLPSTETGYYSLFVPNGYGYRLMVMAEGFETFNLTDINVTIINPVANLDIQLTPASISCNLTTIAPNPNPTISKVQQGGKFHRYYKVFNEITGNPLPLIPVSVTGNGFSQTFYSDAKGILDISINSSNVGSGQPGNQADFSVVSVNNTNLPDPIVFSCVVENQEYGKYWDTYTFGKLGLSFGEVKLQKGSSLSLIGNDLATSKAERFEIKRQEEGEAGVEFSVGVAAGVQCGTVIAGGEAKAGFGGNVAAKTEDQYRFNRSQPGTDSEAIGRYILVTDGIFDYMDQTLYRVLQKCESVFSDQNNLLIAYQGDKKSIEVGVFGTAEAGIGIGNTQDIGVAVAGKLGPEANIAFERKYNIADNEKERSIEYSGKFAASGKAGLNFGMSPDDHINGELGANVMFWNREYERGIRFAYIHEMSQPWHTIKEIQFTLVKRNVHSRTGWEEELTYFISGADLLNAIRNISSINLITQLDNLPDGTVMEVTTGVFKEIAEAIFNTAYYMQTDTQGEASINYKTERTDIQNQGTFEISIDGQFLVSGLKAKIGGGIGFEHGSFYTKENGKWIWGKHFKLQENSAMGTFNDSYQAFMQDVTNDLPGWLKATIGFVDYITFWNKNTTTHYVGDGGSYIEIDEAAIPAGLDSVSCTSWSWYGDSPTRTRNMLPQSQKSVTDGFKSRAQSSFAMEYGYGGFYQFEPFGTQLNDTCWMTIVYDQADVIGIDESTLGMYREDKDNHQWIFIGGIVDTVNNKVTSPITSLELFTLAPAAPYGDFSLNSNPDSLYSDGVSSAIITSDTIFKNNLTPVDNGELYTVITTSGTIITPDADPVQEGIQVLVQNNKIEFVLKSDSISGGTIATAFSVRGSSKASIEIGFYDTLAPGPPIITDIVPGDTYVEMSWEHNTEPDLAGYRIYYDTDTILPLEGIHTVYGESSPLDIGVSTFRKVNGLFNDSTYYFALSAIDVSGNESELSDFISAKPGIMMLSVNVFLEGAFNGNDVMNSNLLTGGFLPLSQPYNTQPWNYTGTETVTTIPDGVVDWILVELRDAPTPEAATSATVISGWSKAMLLKSDGSVVDLNGNQPAISFPLITNNLYIVVRHRNHVGIMSSGPLVLTENVYSYDFTDAITKAYGDGSGYKLIGTGIYGMVAGDGDGDGSVFMSDRSVWRSSLGTINTYSTSDFDMDGNAFMSDRTLWRSNLGGSNPIYQPLTLPLYQTQIPD